MRQLMLTIILIMKTVIATAGETNPVHLYEWRDSFDDAVNDSNSDYGLNDGLESRMDLDSYAVPSEGYWIRTSGHWSDNTIVSTDVQVASNVLTFFGANASGVMLNKILYLNPQGLELSMRVNPAIGFWDNNKQLSVSFDGALSNNGFPSRAHLGIAVTAAGRVFIYQNGILVNGTTDTRIDLTPKDEYELKLVISDVNHDGIKILDVYENGELEGSVRLPHYIPETVYMYLSAYHYGSETMSSIDDLYVFQKGPILRSHEILYVDTFDRADRTTEDATGLNSSLMSRNLYGPWATETRPYGYVRRRAATDGHYNDIDSIWYAQVNHYNVPDKLLFESNMAITIDNSFDASDGLYVGFKTNPGHREQESNLSSFITLDELRDVNSFPEMNDVTFEITSSGEYSVYTDGILSGRGNVSPSNEYDVELLFLPRMSNLSRWALYGQINGERFEIWLGRRAVPLNLYVSLGSTDPGEDFTVFDTLIIAKENLFEDGHIKYAGNWETRTKPGYGGDSITVDNVRSYFNYHFVSDVNLMDDEHIDFSNKIVARNFRWEYFKIQYEKAQECTVIDDGELKLCSSLEWCIACDIEDCEACNSLKDDWEENWSTDTDGLSLYEQLSEAGKLSFLFVNDEPILRNYDILDFSTLTRRIRSDLPHVPQQMSFSWKTVKYHRSDVMDFMESAELVGVDHYVEDPVAFNEVEVSQSRMAELAQGRKLAVWIPSSLSRGRNTDEKTAELTWLYYDLARRYSATLAINFLGRWVLKQGNVANYVEIFGDDADGNAFIADEFIPLTISSTEIVGKLVTDPVIFGK